MGLDMRFKSRKLISAAIIFVTATTFFYWDKATFSEWSDFIKWVFGIYAVGNVGEHYTRKEDDE